MSIINPSGRPPVVTPVTGFDARIVGELWPWAEENAEAIAAHWRAQVEQKPQLFDGKVLVARRCSIEDGVLRSAHIAIPFSALLYWRNSGFPGAAAFNVFAPGLVITRDGAVLLGEMAPHTANAGRVYFPCGTPDLSDVIGERLDLEGSMIRELAEETGLPEARLYPSEERWVSQDGALVCCARRIDTDLTADEVAAIAAAHIAAEAQPELSRVVLMRHTSEADPACVPAYARALLEAVLGS